MVGKDLRSTEKVESTETSPAEIKACPMVIISGSPGNDQEQDPGSPPWVPGYRSERPLSGASKGQRAKALSPAPIRILSFC